jgi:geranylgeranyl diphosphate synthase type II
LAVNAGDAMNAASVRLLRQNVELLGPVLAARVFDEFDHMSIETIEGQAMELGWIRDNVCSTTEDDYMLMVLKKTSWYSFIHPARIGALIAQPEREDLGVFDRFGHFLGLAFQIQDDVLNLTGDQEKYGKEIGGDLLEGKRTLILAHLFKSIGEQERLELERFFGTPRNERGAGLERVYELLRTYGSIEYAKAAAREFARGAQREFDSAYSGATPGPDLDFLRSLLDYVTAREL